MAQNDIDDEEIVGFENEAEKIIQYLIRGTNELDLVPIVGMGGQGKTTIARKVYSNDMIVSHFDVRAWCIISQTYNRRDILQEIFSQVTGSKDKGDKDDILADKLRKSLMGKRYLIVLDDMWDNMAWDDLRLCFHDGENRNRIVVTTRLEKVGKHVKRYTDLYFLPLLTPDESCKLLQKKVFQQEYFPPELHDVSLEVAKRCKGLPLEVVLVAGIIKRKKMEACWWHEVKNSLLSSLGESEGYSLSTMQLSYDNLPNHLKPCLLYMGTFLEDARIPVSKFISLWIEEGFLQNIESGRLMEEAAEDYLMDLISSNVVMVSRRRYNGKVKTCQVHDIVLHFCLERSREEKFMLAMTGYFQPSDWKVNRVSFSFSYEISKTGKPFHQHLRSLITTIEENLIIGIPSVSDTSDFWKREKLRHVAIDNAVYDLEEAKQGMFEESSKLENLRILRNVEFLIDSVDVLLERCPNIQELEISIKGGIFPKLESLTQLQVLHLSVGSLLAVPGLHLPSNLKKLVLTGTDIERAISFIAGLPSLEYLQLQDGFTGVHSRDWCLGDTTFLKLKILKLVRLDISRWDASEESFPLLETLVISDCHELVEIPSSFADISSVKQITVIRCANKTLGDSASKIREEVEENEGCNRIDLSTINVVETNSYVLFLSVYVHLIWQNICLIQKYDSWNPQHKNMEVLIDQGCSAEGARILLVLQG